MNKKIKFHDDSDEESAERSEKCEVLHMSFGDKTEQEIAKKTLLFGDACDSEGEETSFKIRSQFEGSEGRKLLELQSRYGNDKRFKLDEKFYESEDDTKKSIDEVKSGAIDDERNQQLAILQDVLGHHFPLTEEKKVPKSMRMLRFDPTKVEHTKFEKETTTKKETQSNKEIDYSSAIGIKSRTKNRKDVKNVENDINVPVSKEKFYKVSDSLKESLQKKGEQSTFSIRELFGKGDQGSEEQRNDDSYSDLTLKKHKQVGFISNPFKYDTSDDDDDDEQRQREEKAIVSADMGLKQNQTHLGENFFFTSDDPRFQEGLDFFNKNQVKEESLHDFAKYRRELKQFVRLKVRNNLRNHRPFKKKIGGNKRKMLRKKH